VSFSFAFPKPVHGCHKEFLSLSPRLHSPAFSTHRVDFLSFFFLFSEPLSSSEPGLQFFLAVTSVLFFSFNLFIFPNSFLEPSRFLLFIRGLVGEDLFLLSDRCTGVSFF